MTDTATHVLTDQGVPIGWSIIADRPELGYLADPDASRPATAAELAATEAAAYLEYAAAMAANAAIGTAPRGPWPVARAAAPAPEPADDPEAANPFDALPAFMRSGTVPPEAVAETQPEPAADLAPVLGPIAELALERFQAQHDAQDQREATATLPAVDAVDAASTETVPSVTEEATP